MASGGMASGAHDNCNGSRDSTGRCTDPGCFAPVATPFLPSLYLPETLFPKEPSYPLNTPTLVVISETQEYKSLLRALTSVQTVSTAQVQAIRELNDALELERRLHRETQIEYGSALRELSDLRKEYDEEVVSRDIEEKGQEEKLKNANSALQIAGDKLREVVREVAKSAKVDTPSGAQPLMCSAHAYGVGYGIHGCCRTVGHPGKHLCYKSECNFEWEDQ